MEALKKKEALEQQIKNLRQQLDEANDTINAIQKGQVDGFVIRQDKGQKIYTLKSADQNYRVFIEKMREGAVTLNRKGIILYSNSRFASMVDLPLTQIIGSYFKKYIESSGKKTFDKLLKKVGQSEYKEEFNLISENKKLIPVLLSLTNLELDEEAALSLIINDLSDQKNIEKQLRKNYKLLEAAKAHTEKLNNELEERVKERTQELLTSQEYFNFLADTIPVIVWTANAKGDYDYFNKQWYKYTGLTFEESQRKGWKPFIHPDDQSKTFKQWEKSIKSGKSFKIENRLRSVDGAFRWHLVHALPFKNNEGKILAWFGVSTDIEEQKKDLQKKDEFISMASHELKTPVTSLKSLTEIMVMDAGKKGNKNELRMLKKMDKQINRLTSLIADLLDVSKTNAGQLNYDYEKVDFNNLVKEIISVLQLTTSHKLELNLTNSVNVKADKNRLGQVITNLVSNAIKYSPLAERVFIYSENIGKQVKLYVQDFGIGIPLSEQPKVFSRFFRMSENTYPGLGLGLYICKEIVSRHSGNINFKSEENKGSTFCFSIPIEI